MMHYFDPTVNWSIALDAAIDLVIVETANLEKASEPWQSSAITSAWIQYATASESGHCLVMTFLGRAPVGEHGQKLQIYLDGLDAEGVPVWLYRRSTTVAGPRRLVAAPIITCDNSSAGYCVGVPHNESWHYELVTAPRIEHYTSSLPSSLVVKESASEPFTMEKNDQHRNNANFVTNSSDMSDISGGVTAGELILYAVAGSSSDL